MVQQVKPPFVASPRPRRILVIGGGVAGLAALRALVEDGGVRSSDSDSKNNSGNGSTNSTNNGNSNGHSVVPPFECVELIERRDNIGGVWYLNEDTVALEKSFKNGTANGQWPVSKPSSGTPLWPSPAYPALRGNVLPRFLSFAGTDPFPPPASSVEARSQSLSSSLPTDAPDPFPTLSETHSYLERIAQPLRPHIRCNVECLGVWELPDPRDASKNRWAVRVRDWTRGGAETTEYWDAVVLSVGWTDKPNYPRIEGMSDARQAGFIEHCKWYRGPEPYSPDQRIVVVGNGNSGNDVCAQLAARRVQGKHEPVIRICRHKAWFFYVSLPDPLIRDVPAMEKLVVQTDSDGCKRLDIHLIDGQVITNVDRVILAAGYEIGQFPFVHVLDEHAYAPFEAQQLASIAQRNAIDWTPDASLSAVWRSISSAPHGTTFDEDGVNPPRVSGLFWHFLHQRAATLALVNLCVTSIPFWTSDTQSHCIRAIWDGTLTLPDSEHGRGEYERGRLALIRSLHEQKAENERKVQEAWKARQKAQSDGEDTPSFEAPEHIYLVPYHVLGTLVGDYLPFLRDMAVKAKPAWQQRLPHFTDVQSYHDGMYDLKFNTLKAKRAAVQVKLSGEKDAAEPKRPDVTV